MKIRRSVLRIWLVFFLGGVVGCVATGADNQMETVPAPTVNPIFIPVDVPTEEPLPDIVATPGISDLATQETAVVRAIIYDEELNPNWSIQASSETVTYSLQNTQSAHDGNNAIAITSFPAKQSLYFRVLPETEAYQRDRVIGISLWLSGGAENIEPGSIILGVTGSDIQPHWVANDTSAGKVDEILTFSGTRAYSLGLKQAVTKGSWVRVVVLLDDLVFDPDHNDEEVEDPEYEYVTGFYLTAEENLQTILIDDISLIMAKSE
jgi:hypothetical protein